MLNNIHVLNILCTSDLFKPVKAVKPRVITSVKLQYTSKKVAVY